MSNQRALRVDHLLVLRGLAAVAVMVSHLQARTGTSGFGPDFDWLIPRNGYPPVLFFFTLSGYLITKTFVTGRYDVRVRHDLLDYYRNRLLRILPLYYFTIFVCAAFYLERTLAKPGSVAGLFVFTESYRNAEPIIFNQPYWTIPIEVFYYVLAPGIYLSMRAWVERIGWLTLLLTILAAFAGYTWLLFGEEPVRYGAVVLSKPDWNLNAHHAFLYNFEAFLIGALANFAVRSARKFRFTASRSLRFSMRVVFAIGVVLIFLHAGHVSRNLQPAGLMSHFFLYGLVPTVGLLVGMLAWLQDTRDSAAVRRSGVEARILIGMEWVGLFSYGIYLWNRPMLDLVESAQTAGLLPEGALITWAVVAAATVCVSALSWYAVEKPFLAFRSRKLELEVEVLRHRNE